VLAPLSTDTLNAILLGSLESVLRAYAQGTIFGETSGEGQIRVLFLHGWGRSKADFSDCAALLKEHGVTSLALDLPGFGASPVPARAGGAREYAALVLPVLQEVAASPLVVVGHSFGGRIASVLASTHPELISAVLFTGAPLVKSQSSGRSPLAYRLLRRARSLGLVSEARLEQARQRYGSSDYRAAQGVMREVLVATVNESYEPELAGIHQPTSFLWGADDQAVGVTVAESAMALVPGEHHLRVLPGVGHLVPTSAAAELARATKDLLS
jgi:pimeloyl-ACP methyl ester carboxylesterase